MLAIDPVEPVGTVCIQICKIAMAAVLVCVPPNAVFTRLLAVFEN